MDILTEVAYEKAIQVLHSPYANLLAVNENRLLVGVFNRFMPDVNFNSKNLRKAFNLAINRHELIEFGFQNYATPVPSMTPPWHTDYPEDLLPYPYDSDRARTLLWEGGWPIGRRLRLAALKKYEGAASLIANTLQRSLHIETDLTIIPPDREGAWLHVVAEKKLLPSWDILLVDVLGLFTEAAPTFFHREFLGYDGKVRAGPILPAFEKLYDKYTSQPDRLKRIPISQEIDRYVYEEALALFLCAPQNLYAVNRHVKFLPHRTTLEFAETEVTDQHWSRRTGKA